MSQSEATQETPPTPDGPARGPFYQVTLGAAVVGAVFTAVICLLLVVDYARRTARDPMEDPQFLALKEKLVQDPRNEQLKEEIRQLDLQLRQEYFGRRRFAALGAYLLFGGAVVTIVSSITAASLRWKAPRPEAGASADEDAERVGAWGRTGVAVLGGVLIGGAVTAAMLFPTILPDNPDELALRAAEPPAAPAVKQPAMPGAEPENAPTAKTPDEKPAVEPAAKPSPVGGDTDPSFATAEERAKAWLRFRGPGGAGHSAYDNVPTEWDEASGKGIAWKTAVPLPGNGSPIVWKDRVFLAGATEKRREVYCFDAADGKLLWQKEVPGTPQSTANPPEVSQDTGFAAPTMAGDGRRVFAMFANGDVAGFDLAGNLLWSRSLGIPESSYGHAASLEMFENLLLVQFDQASLKAAKSKMLALEATTGKTVWEMARPVPNSWASPIVVNAAGKTQLIACGDPWVISYNPKDGQEIWRAKCLSGDVGVSAVADGDVIYVGNEYCKWSAIRADGSGDVTESHVLWTGEEGLPDMCSPLVGGKYLFLLTSFGILTCYDKTSGEMLWDKEFEDAQCASSPGWAGGRVYLFAEKESEEEDAEGNYVKFCEAWVFEPGDEEAKIVGSGKLGEGCVTSPAFQDGRIYIRGRKHLYCLGKK